MDTPAQLADIGLAPVANEELATLHLDLWIKDQDLIDKLVTFAEGRPRQAFALNALKIGVLALSHAQSNIDVHAVRTEGERLIATLSAHLATHQGQVTAQLTSTLREYFDPASGRFTERVERLVRKDGELEQLLRSRMDDSIVGLKSVLDPYLGEESRLMGLLSPGESNELISAIKTSVDQVILQQQTLLLGEFSLDNKAGALTRLVSEISSQNGALGAVLKSSMDEVVKEFSLDNDESALCRLIKRVESAQVRINSEFTLDSETSALSRIRRDVTALIDGIRKDSAQFQERVVAALEAMKARKQESFASTTHGKVFEDAAFQMMEAGCQEAGDIAERTGERTGILRNCKKGDAVITIGPDAEAAGARIACEMKEDGSYDLARSLRELQEARNNREATVGLFVHSKRTAPAGLRPLARYGNDVVVVWDSEDSGSDVFLTAGLIVSKALALRKAVIGDRLAADFDILDKTIREIERQAGFLSEIETSSQTIKNGAEKILKRVETMRCALQKQVEALDEQSAALRELAASQTS